MSDKPQEPRRSQRLASRQEKQPYKALLIRAQSPEQPEATGSKQLKMKSKKAVGARKGKAVAGIKPPYPRMRCRTPEPVDYDYYFSSSSEGTSSETSSEGTSSEELEVKRRKINDSADSEAKI
ncbi:unnamed protein product [Microthlaspi erraticum]|uniref:Uncharacterized protein n=1 Tax=Microthlaspi erraticum TaxID=1685480 RepID=A0A6D2IS14_9BRAS|nr:unnamed protein product [Microthlaspi erraticum]